MAQDHWREIRKARQRLVLCRLMIDIMRTVHGAYAPVNEPFGGRRRLAQLQSWGLIDRQGRHYHLHEKTLNSLMGMRSYQQVRRILSEATTELSVLDTLPD